MKKLRMPVPFGQVYYLVWDRDGTSFLYARTEKGVSNVWSASLDGKPPRKITNFDSERIFGIDMSADNRLLLVRGHWVHDLVLIKLTRE